uniref:Cytochrome P450 2K1-like n=1 Tax=Cyclopterus lumpus TaxID=8103 RepID=A0A8C2ZR00_CYCLU
LSERFAITNLRDFGMGKKACEDKIIEECEHLMTNKIIDLSLVAGEAFDTTHAMNYAVSNIICSMVYGSRFEYNDLQFKSLVDGTTRNTQLMAVQHVPMDLQMGFQQKRKTFAFNMKQNSELFGRLKETLNPQMCRGFVDAFLVRKQNMEESGKTNSHFHHENLMVTVLNLFAAGTDTTATTLRWGLLLMAKYPKIQNQVQEELSRMIGSRQVQVEDRKNLPFTDAVIHETQRLASIVPIISHRTSQDVTFQGHFIKKGTTVIPLLSSVLHDESEWEEPHSFHPAHFLDKDGKFFKRDAFMPFSAGRRVCVGESLARMELFIFFVSLLQHFRFTPPSGVSEDELDLTPRVGFTLNPVAHALCAVSRD